MMCICISIKYVFVDLYETAPLIDKYVNKMNLLQKDIFELYKMKSIVDMAMITYFYNKLKQLGMMTMTLYAIV